MYKCVMSIDIAQTIYITIIVHIMVVLVVSRRYKEEKINKVCNSNGPCYTTLEHSENLSNVSLL